MENALIQSLLQTEDCSPELERSSRAVRLLSRAGRQVQRLPCRHEGLRRHERSLH